MTDAPFATARAWGCVVQNEYDRRGRGRAGGGRHGVKLTLTLTKKKLYRGCHIKHEIAIEYQSKRIYVEALYIYTSTHQQLFKLLQ